MACDSLRGRSLFITGGAHGIGEAIARLFIERGASVAIFDIDQQRTTALAKECGVLPYVGDAADAKSLELALEGAHEEMGGIDIIVNCVGVSRFKPLTEISIEEFDNIIDVNLRSAFVTSRWMAIKRKAEKERYGRIINMSSTRHLQSEPHSEAYAASKGGIVSLTHALALSLAEYNITVNCISPGWIDSASDKSITAADHAQHPSRRVGVPDDIARMVLFLAAEENDFINGENITVDGGMTKKMIYL